MFLLWINSPTMLPLPCVQLLDLFPDEAGGKNKRARVIPFLPGKRFPFSSINSKEKAEKRFPEIVKYVRYVRMDSLGMKCQIVSLLNSYHACFLVVWMCRYCLNSVCDSLCVHACMCTCVCVCVFTVYVCTYCMYVSGMHLNIRTYV